MEETLDVEGFGHGGPLCVVRSWGFSFQAEMDMSRHVSAQEALDLRLCIYGLVG